MKVSKFIFVDKKNSIEICQITKVFGHKSTYISSQHQHR